MRTARLAITAVCVIGASFGLASPAQADPGSCSVSITAGTVPSAGGSYSLHATSDGFCQSQHVYTVVVEIKRDIDSLPDVKVSGQSTNNSNSPSTRWSISTSSCDSGRNAVYYGRGYFTTDTSYHDSTHTRVLTCT